MANPTSSRPNVALYGVTILVSLAITGVAIWRVSGGMVAAGADSAAALAMPSSGEPDFRFYETSPWVTTAIPTAARFDFPAGTENGSLLKVEGGNFTGIGGKNASLGDPVFAVADGVVVFSGETSTNLGEVIVIAHRGADRKPLRSVYGCLHQTDVKIGAVVARGAKIGAMGTANGHHPAGLIFTLDDKELADGFTGTGDAREMLGKLRNAAPEAPFAVAAFHNVTAYHDRRWTSAGPSPIVGPPDV